ncbi:uncharacterized protein TRAVEDRAFT_53902 [Trametes versicolor FP-101664 SS1]|uniref:Uncharacterized protein n=1 Tax=Trametes versicolor (strain FP-101664) TaxID=717944 RepID=R7S8B7_TRAVS|nr:uncharacterized protein TRAVEDRAFT_53902 [Trametes versicolor FP-101664 SS1]EIW51907.1 hypothetical protein TRAVEDRAFT_53902 [Trametes versicolor FP-101664 SS1]
MTPAPLTYYWNTSGACELDDCVARLRREVSLPDLSVRSIGFDLWNVNLNVPHTDILFADSAFDFAWHAGQPLYTVTWYKSGALQWYNIKCRSMYDWLCR